MSGSGRDRNIRLPSRQGKKDSPSVRPMSRPAEGRAEVPKASPKPQERQQKPRQGNSNRGGRDNRDNRGRQGGRGGQQRGRGQQRGGPRQGGRQQSRGLPRNSPLNDETWARVIDHDVDDNVIVAVTEERLIPCRLKPKDGITPLLTTERIYIGKNTANREHVEDILGMASLGRMAPRVRMDLPLVVQIFVEENAQHFITTFFNRAGNLSLKQHAFELLHGVGNKKALQMVEQRGSSGFSDLAHLNESCGIDAAELLAKRFVDEIEDRNLQPRLIDLLLPVKA